MRNGFLLIQYLLWHQSDGEIDLLNTYKEFRIVVFGCQYSYMIKYANTELKSDYSFDKFG